MNREPQTVHYSPEYIIKFVREVRGDEAAERVAADPEALEYWDEKIADWASD